MVGIIVFLFIALGGGASFAAESSVPGDVLYPVKTEVNEQVRGMLTLGVEAQAGWEARLAERRLEEAGKLSEEGKLDAEAVAELSSAFAAHSEAAIKAAQSVKEDEMHELNDNDEEMTFEEVIMARLQTSIDAHGELFRVASGDVNGDGRADVAVAKKGFVLPHVLEKVGASILAPRDSMTGQASGKAAATTDVDVSVKDSDASAGVDVGVGGSVELRESPSKASTGGTI